MTSYKKPSKLNPVSILLVLIALAAVYSLIQFGPPYWRKWKVKEILSSTASRVFPRRNSADDEFLGKIREGAIKEIHAAGVKDPAVEVFIKPDSTQVTVSADYRERIDHPFVNKSTTLHFRPHTTVEKGISLE